MAGFSYVYTKYRYVAYFKDGEWSKGELTTDSTLHIDESSTALHYGQQCFEGLKAYRCADGTVNIFRPEMNARRMAFSCDRILMPSVSEEQFIDAITQVVKANSDVIPAYGTGESLYLRPFIIGVGPNLGVKAASEFMFVVFASPVGSYFANGLTAVSFMTSDYDRAAPNGTGQAKVGGNYAASLLANKEAKAKGFADCIYLDPKTHTKIEEVGAANFFGITSNNEFITPKSSSILESITRLSLMDIAKGLGYTVLEQDVLVDELDQFIETGACGTAAAITPIKSILHQDKLYEYLPTDKPGIHIQKLYDELTSIYFETAQDKRGWNLKISI